MAVSESGSRRTVETVAAGQPRIERVLAMEQFGDVSKINGLVYRDKKLGITKTCLLYTSDAADE